MPMTMSQMPTTSVSTAMESNGHSSTTTPAVTDLVAGQVQVMFDVTPTSLAHIKAGKLRTLGVTTTEPLPFLPDVPTIAELMERMVAEARSVHGRVNAQMADEARTPALASV